MTRRRCSSSTGMIWSMISRRQLPIHLSAVPFCHGARMLVRFAFNSGRLSEGNDVAIENGIVIQDGVAIWSRLRKGFAELLHDPICRRMLRDVEVQDPTAFVLDDEETVQHAEGRGGNGEEVEGDDG